MKRTILLVATLALGGLEARAQSAADICRSSKCSTDLAPMLEQLEACKGSYGRIGALEKERDGLKKKSEALEGERDDAKTALETCTADAGKHGKEAEGLAEAARKEAVSARKELDDLKKATADAGGDPQKLAEAVRLANAWKNEADRIKEESEAAKKEASDLKIEMTGLQAEIKTLKDDATRNLGRIEPDKSEPDKSQADASPKTDASPKVDASPKPDGGTLGDLELKTRKLQEILDDTRRVLIEKEREKEISDTAIRHVMDDLTDLLGRTFECSSFSVDTHDGVRTLKGTVSEDRHRDQAWKMVLDSPIARLLQKADIDVTAAGGQVCFVRTRVPGWLMARSRDKSGQAGQAGPGGTLFLRFQLDANVIQMLPRATDHADCETLGGVVKALEPLSERPSQPAVWVRGGNGAVTQCYADAEGWKLRPRVEERNGKWEAWILLRQGDQAGGGQAPTYGGDKRP